jgi:hypothetical protein
MRTPQFSVETLESFFHEHIIGTMQQLKETLGTSVDMTVYRKLRQLSYLTSYSHQGKYYTLEELADFDAFGLWHFDVARFSKKGTLLQTSQALIDKSENGYSLVELRSLVGIDVKETVLQLQRQHRIYRENIAGRYVYFSSDPKRRRGQDMMRLPMKFAPRSSFSSAFWTNGNAVCTLVWNHSAKAAAETVPFPACSISTTILLPVDAAS